MTHHGPIACCRYRTLADLAGIDDAAIETGVQGQNFATVIRNGGGNNNRLNSNNIRNVDPKGVGGRRVAGGKLLLAEPPIGFALSQMTRCAKSNASATYTFGYNPCAKTPGMLMGCGRSMQINSRGH